MFKKIASFALAATMVVGSAAITASAAETDTDAAAAADQSAAVAADDSSAVGADASSSTGSGQVFNFDVNSAGWNNVKTVFCHIYRADGTGTWTSWQSKAEKCSYDTSTGIATYDIKTGMSKAPDLGTLGAKNEWCIMFSANTGMETYPLLLNTSCYGDTAYAPDKNKKLENNVDDAKSSVEIRWKKNSSLTAAKTITSTAKIQGSSFAEGETNETILASYLISYYNDAAKLKKVQGLVNTLNVSPVAVMTVASAKVESSVKSGATKAADGAKQISAIKKTLTGLTDPTTGKKTDDSAINGATDAGKQAADNGTSIDKVAQQAASDGSSSGSKSSSNSSNSSSSGSSSSGSGSSTVSSGQEETIFFVFGGLMLAAAGVMFLCRRKRED